MNNNKTAIILGATGLVGKSLVKQLIKDDHFSKIKLIVRRSSGVNHEKVEEYIVDFEDANSYKDFIKGDVLFSSMGTTLKQAGSKEAQYKVDFQYQYDLAKIAVENGVHDYILVSSSGANAKSKMFYTRMKGDLDKAVMEMPFERCLIFRPSLLVGEREKKRNGEIIGKKVMDVFGKIIPGLSKYKPITGKEVAMAMIAAYKKEATKKVEIYTLDELFGLLN